MAHRPGTWIRRDVLVGATALLGLFGVGLFLFVRGFANDAADRALDRVLSASALSIAESIRVEDDHLTLELPQAALTILGAARQSRVFYAVRGPDHSLITGYDDMPDDQDTAPDRSPQFFDAIYLSEPVRVGVVSRYIDFGERSGWMTVTVAETREARAQLASVILRNSFVPIVIAGVVACLVIAKVLGIALAPLVALEAELTQRVPGDLGPIRAPFPREVAALVASLNAFMQRLDKVLHALRGLVVEAAHGVRTPLASIRALAEVALSERDVEAMRGHVDRILTNIVDATRIVNQLLAEATVAHHAERSANVRCDLLEICLEVLDQLPARDAQRCRLAEIAPTDDDFPVLGGNLAFRELISNLVDNALKYAPGGLVEITLRTLPDESLIQFDVADRGPGLSDEEKPLLFERFQRGSTAAEIAGSGLGLGIAKSVAMAAGGTLSLLDREGGGVIARILVPRAA